MDYFLNTFLSRNLDALGEYNYEFWLNVGGSRKTYMIFLLIAHGITKMLRFGTNTERCVYIFESNCTCTSYVQDVTWRRNMICLYKY